MMQQAPAGWTPVKPPDGWTPAKPPESVSADRLPVSATFNGQPVELPETLGESFGAFGTGLKEMVDPRPLFQALYSQGVPAVVRSLGQAQQDQYEKARRAFTEGRWSEGLGYTAAWLMPLIGPAAATAGETIGSGEIARGTGQAVGILAPFGAKATAGRVRAGLASSGERLAEAGEARLAKQMTPQTGPNKLRFAQEAKKAAPTIVREPGMGAWSVDELARKIQDASLDASRGIDESYATIPKTRQYPTAPIVARLDQAIKELQVRGTSGAIDPANYAETLATLRQARAEVQGAGNLISIDNLRKLTTAWQKGAEEAYTPSVVADAFKARGRGKGWARAGSSARDYLVTKEPGTAAANARYSLIENAREAIEAARETEFVRPARGRGYTAKIVGGTIGLGAGGGEGALAGVLIATLLEKVEATATAQIQLARTLAKVGDAFKAGKPQQAMALLQRESERFGVVIPGVARAQGGPVAVPVGENQAMPGVPTIGPRDSTR